MSAFVFNESEPVSVDRDEVFFIYDCRLRVDGTAIPPTVAAVGPGKASSLAFSSDSEILAIRAGDAVTLWDTSTSQQLGILPVGGTGGPVAVSPRGTLLADATINGGIGVWGTPYIANTASYLCGRTGQSFPAAAWARLALGVPYMRAC